MTPTRRRPTTPASQGPTRTAPDAPVAANSNPRFPAETMDSAELLGAYGNPAAQKTATRDAGEDSARPKATGQVGPEHRATTQSRRRPRGLPLPVWPD